jgi:hypothetical protein
MMKKKGFKFLIISLLAITIFCLNATAAEFYFKGFGGWSHATTRGYLDPLNNVAFGTGLEFWAFKPVGIEIDILYVKKGHKEDDPTFYQNSDGSFASISLPVLARVRVPLGKNYPLSFGLLGGVNYSFILNDMDNNFSNHDFGFMVGGTLDVKVEQFVIFLDGRFDWGTEYLAIEYLPHRVQFQTSTFYVMTGIKLRL